MGFTTNVNYSVATGANSNNGQIILFETRDPTASDTAYPVGKQWFNTVLNNFWILESFSTSSGYPQAVWEQFGTSMESITQYAVLVGGASSTIASITPDASTTKVLVSGGLSANPSWQSIGSGALSIGTFGSTPNSGGASISGSTLTLQPADGTNPGGISTTSQTIAGAKTFTSDTTVTTSTSATTRTLTISNTDNTSGTSNAKVGILNGGASSGDPFLALGVSGSFGYGFGIDTSDSANLKITNSYNGPSSGTTFMQITTAGVPSFPAAPLGVTSGGTGLATTTANAILYSTSTNVIGQTTPVIDGVMISNHAAGVPSFLANGTAGYVLTAQSGAPPAWSAGSVAGLTVNIFTFAASDTYTPTSGMKYCKIEGVAPGGGGGGASTGAGIAITLSVGGGGGSGESGFVWASAATIGASQAITIGAVGSGGGAASSGTGGGQTVVGSLLTLNGGAGGTGGADTGAGGNLASAGGAGGTGGSGGTRIAGSPGSTGLTTVAVTIAFSVGGAGAPSAYGGGSPAAVSNALTAGAGVSTSGNASTGYGAGGGGASNISTTTSQPAAPSGSNGSSGLVIITEFIAT